MTAFGLGVLKLSPHAFWRATPREIAAAARGLRGGRSSAPPLARPEFDALMARFPDEAETHG
ncbi:phage tail assembly chaperone [Methylopila henanensis]|uniref:Phage tail assembly chaperone n=1 Tax=Methylopila henanensis TaxID=873516 RepID=A0ABW4K240_9HYPH